MLLIDVVDECLVLGRLDVDFVAMSYVWGAWGGANVTETTKESLEFFCRKGGLRGLGESIPCVIRDAMALVRGIGQRYLWCDLLCVVSDNLEVKKSQIEMMDVVYSEASLTIIALTGLHGNMELPGVRPGTREPICLSETLENGARFLTRHVPLTSFYDQTKYTKRGWTFQEELLSRKCLYITNRQMYFKCGLVHYREDESLFSQNEDESVESCLNSFPAGYSSLANVGQNFDVYCELLSEYSRRQLTFDDDILKAFEGITSILAQKYQSEFLEGLPVRFLSDALLWIPSHHTRRRLETDPSEMQTGHPPTWSWAAWDGRV
ncbi:heterokaryon incompatibility protein-domain-containing protein, partial [Phyllosticta capitalensis]